MISSNARLCYSACVGSKTRQHGFYAPRPLLTGVVFAWAALASGGCRFVSGGEARERTESRQIQAQRLTGDPWIDGVLPEEVLLGAPRRGGQVTVQIDADPTSLNSNIDSDYWGSQIVANHIVQTLVSSDRYDDPRFQLRPELAESWSISPDQRTYTFNLRRGVKWHDGAEFSARDVIATFDKVQDPTSKCASMRAYTQDIVSYESPDAYTVRFQVNQPYFLMMDGVFASVIIQPAHIIKGMSGTAYSEAATNPLNRAPIGTGPFRFIRWVNGQLLELARNDDYWGNKPHLDRLLFRIVREAPVSLELAERGELDVVSRVRAAQWVRLAAAPLRKTFNRSLYYDANYRWIGWNQLRPQFQSPRVRRALTMLIDRPGIINALEFGLAKPTDCHFYWASHACDASLPPIPYDPIQAVALLESEGWRDHDGDGIRDKAGLPFQFTFLVPSVSEEAARMGTKMKEDFYRAGIDVRLQRVEWSAFVRRVTNHDFDACTMLWASGPRSDPTQIWSSQSIDGGSNFVSFRNTSADELMQRARVELDDDRRDSLYRLFGKILYDEQPYTWIYVRPRMSLYSKRLRGVRNSLLGWQFEDWWVTDASTTANDG